MRIHSGAEYVDLDLDSLAEGANLLDAIRAAGVPFAAPCAGKGTCGKCTVLAQQSGGGTKTVQACKTPASGTVSITISDAAGVLDCELAGEALALAGHRHGVAIDLGSSTLAAELVDLDTGLTVARAGRMNPQSIFGADVISRIEAAEAGHLGALTRLINDALRGMISALCAKAGLAQASLVDITLAGNTIMQHLLQGLSPASIGVYPYEPLSYFGEPVALWPELPPVWLAPCISGYVGGDIVAGMLSEGEKPFLLIDLGTNGELALQTGSVSVAAATAAGPVFEGMNVRSGMPALPGAVSRARYDAATDTLEVAIIGDGEAKGLCGSGLIDLAALLVLHGVVDESGRLLTSEQCASPLAARVVEEENMRAFKPLAHADILVTQKDIRNLQLAKAAIAGGIAVVLDTAELALDGLARVAIAGGLGQHIDQYHAAVLGLIPKELLDRTESVGNSSLAGARKALLDPSLRAYMGELAGQVHYVELSTDGRFMNLYLENMGFE